MSAVVIAHPITEQQCPDWCGGEHEALDADTIVHRGDILKNAWGEVYLTQEVQLDGWQVLVYAPRITLEEDGSGFGSATATEACEIAAAIVSAADLVDTLNAVVSA